jgi:hypothetical protein
MQIFNIQSHASHESSDNSTQLVNRVSENTFTVKDYVEDKDFQFDLFHPKFTPEIQFWVGITQTFKRLAVEMVR